MSHVAQKFHNSSQALCGLLVEPGHVAHVNLQEILTRASLSAAQNPNLMIRNALTRACAAGGLGA